MRIAFGLLILVLGSVLAGSTRPIYPQDFEVRGCTSIDARDPEHPVIRVQHADWISTDEGWIASCQGK